MPRRDGGPRERLGVLVEAEPVARLVGDAAEDARRVVDERRVVHHADRTAGEVGATAVRIEEGAEIVGAERHSHRVDGEVAAVEVVRQLGMLNGRQGARSVIRLAAGRDDVDVLVASVGDDRSPNFRCGVACPPSASARRLAKAMASPSTARSMSSPCSSPSRMSRTVPPTTKTSGAPSSRAATTAAIARSRGLAMS